MTTACTGVGALVMFSGDAVRHMGTQILQEPAEYPWGRRAVLRDPDGRPVEVFTRPNDPV